MERYHQSGMGRLAAMAARIASCSLGFRRIKRFNNELDMWMPLNRDISSWLAQEGHLTGLEGISTERTLELIPSLTLSETGKRKGTLTPAQLNAGLLDPGRIFNTQIAAVHTRSIIDPVFAVKLTGKVGRNTFGILVASDNGPGNLSEDDRSFIVGNPFFLAGIEDTNSDHLTDSQKAKLASINQQQAQLARILDKNASFGVLRLKRDIGKKDSFIGFLATYRKFVDQYNELG